MCGKPAGSLRRHYPRQEPYALTRPYGSVRGAISDGRPYRDSGPNRSRFGQVSANATLRPMATQRDLAISHFDPFGEAVNVGLLRSCSHLQGD